MTVRPAPQGQRPPAPALASTLEEIAARAAQLDRNPRFPEENVAALRAVGVPQLAGDRDGCSFAWEVATVRALAAADASTARILDGHLNGVERLALLGADPWRERDLAAVRAGAVLVGVWGADPTAQEGAPAWIERDVDGRLTLHGMKTFCSGAGGVQRALVVAFDEHGERRLAYADVTRQLRVDREWYRGSGLRASESHLVEFAATPVIAILGERDEIMREPWFSRDAVRTTATWAGIVDCVMQATLEAVRGAGLDDVRLHAIGRMRVARSSIDRWLDHATAQMERAPALPVGDGARDVTALAVECRVAVSEAARCVAAQAARVCGSRGLVGAGVLDRARRDLDLFLLQHRLDPKLVELGRGLHTGASPE